GQPVGEGAGEERQDEHRRELQRADETQAERRVRQLEHEPRLRHRLHPRADQRDELTEPEQAEVAMTERAQGGGQPRVGRHAGSLLAGPRHGPPNPPGARRAPAQPWRASMLLRWGAPKWPPKPPGARRGPASPRYSRRWSVRTSSQRPSLNATSRSRPTRTKP